ncbi:ribosome maturation factor RimM [endosymbiont of Sipalinus gigas]|uniref:ribosome maturation factor RimM n=1 Tax=endosymbiont of Sipalinus gigas TaxID=1972134 RepID=UPI000DC7252A|nr:ribosome maturation factor RimM [endosymbiont of Sipalinus gigas]BBA85217.1 ribosome maturation factor RimM [endosymbiont of Sipalinus gigas]
MKEVFNNLLVGKIGSSYGVIGYNKVYSYMDNKIDIFKYKWIIILNKIKTTYIVEKWKSYKDNFLVKLNTVDSKEKSSKITNLYIYINILYKDNDFIYLKDILNFSVFFENYFLGNVYDFIEIKYYYILIIKKNNKEIYIPLIFNIFIREINLEKKNIILNKIC